MDYILSKFIRQMSRDVMNESVQENERTYGDIFDHLTKRKYVTLVTK